MSAVSWPPFATSHVPHPILWSPQGIIEALPVHAKQNETLEEVDIDLTAQFSFGSYDAQPEFPGALSSGGPRPEVIAWATGFGRAGLESAGAMPAMRPFGCVGAYDGHKAATGTKGTQLGRVVVDSSWHHWFDSFHGRAGGVLHLFDVVETNRHV